MLNGKNKYIYNTDFEKVLKLAQTGDFVYLDPPYANLNERNLLLHILKTTFISRTKLDWKTLLIHWQKRCKSHD
ncbi:DNA adenine methylase [Mycoplasma sp. ES3157-GEN-MYC]|nr:DNA adenine methylase [Mycoplasma miroungigenitalium]